MSEVEIFNLALARIGKGQLINAPDERSPSAKTCAALYPMLRDEVLRAFAWPFATKIKALAASVQAFAGWEYVYGYPPDALTIRSLTDEAGARYRGSTQTWLEEPLSPALSHGFMPFVVALGSDGTTRVILTDQPDAYAIYTGKVEDPSVFPADFVSTLAWKIGAEVGPSLQADRALIDRATNMYLASIKQTQAHAANEATRDQPFETPSIRART